MAENSFHFQLGNFECLSVLDTVDPMRFDFVFPQVPPSEILKLLNLLDIPIESKFEITCLLIKTGKQTVLIDTGIGVASRPNAGMLLKNLQESGIESRDVEVVIISHGHLDHIGGNVNAELKPTFPNARYVMYKKELEFWTSNPDLRTLDDTKRQELLSCVRKNLMPLKDQITFIDTGVDIVPGIQYILAPGHTPGHSGLLISSNNKQLLYVADVFHNLLQLARPEWSTAFDLAPEQACATRNQIISRAISTNSKVFASHFPFPAVGSIVRRDNSYFWLPV